MNLKYSQIIKLFLLAINQSLYTTNLVVTNSNIHSTPPVSIFGDTIVNRRHAEINALFAYSIPSDKITTELTTTGSAGISNSMALLQTGTAPNGAATIKTKTAIQYVPGHDVEFLFTGAFTSGGATNSSQWIGAFNDNDGFAVGYKDTDFAILYRNFTTGTLVETIIPKTEFNVDRLNGTGPSSINFIPANLNIFKISFGWLGTAPIIFWIMRSDGRWFKFHIIERPNNFTIPSISIPMLQIHAKVINSGNTGNMSLYTASWMGGTIGEDDATVNRIHAAERLNKINIISEVPLLSIKNSTENYYGKTNALNLKILFVCISSQTDNALTVFRLIKNPTLIGHNFTDHAAGLSIAQVDKVATSYTGGTHLLTIFGSNNSSSNLPILNNNLQITLVPGDILTITGSATDYATVNASLTWQEPIA